MLFTHNLYSLYVGQGSSSFGSSTAIWTGFNVCMSYLQRWKEYWKFVLNTLRKKGKSCHWGGTFSKGTLLPKRCILGP